jgi:hypothetical protein
VSKFAVGQVWAYHSRAGEEGSRVWVLRVDALEHPGVIVHVAVEGVALGDPSDPQGPIRAIGFMPLTEASLDASVTQLVAEDPTFIPREDFEAGYRDWKEAFDTGKGGFWTASVAKIVQTMDDGMQLKARAEPGAAPDPPT